MDDSSPFRPARSTGATPRRPPPPTPQHKTHTTGLRHSGEWGTEHLTLLLRHQDSATADRVLAAEIGRRTKAGETMRGFLKRLGAAGWAAPLSPALHPATLAALEVLFAREDKSNTQPKYASDIVMLAHDRTGTKRRRIGSSNEGDGGVDGVFAVVDVVEDERDLKRKKKDRGKKKKKKKGGKKEKKKKGKTVKRA